MRLSFVIAAIVVGIVALCVLIAAAKAKARKKRIAFLLEKYGDQQIVDAIMRRMFWQGQSQEQLIDSLGRPADIDQKVLKTKVKEIWKYNHQGGNRFGLRITLENGIVVGWDQRD